MPDQIKLNDDLTVGSQPEGNEISMLSEDGFKSVINFRTEGEEEQPLPPDEEGQRVRAAGMEYLHVPVSMDSMDQSKVDAFRDQLESLPKPVFAHCKSGKRAGAMTMMHIAVEQNMTGEQTLQKAKEMGFECDKPELMEFVNSYVNDRTNE